MKPLLLGLALALLAPITIAVADSPPISDPAKDGRLVPTVRNGKLEGLKVYAIRAGGRFDQATAKFENGDTILIVDDQPVTEQAGALALYERVLGGKADATVIVSRKGERVTLHSKAIR